MGKWRSFYDVMKLPLGILLIGCLMLVTGNYFSGNGIALYGQTSGLLYDIGMIFSRLGVFIITTHPLFFAMEVSRQYSKRSDVVICSVIGYITFLIATMVISDNALPSNAYTSFFGISMSKMEAYTSSYVTLYPLQTGYVASFVTIFITVVLAKKTKSPYRLIGWGIFLHIVAGSLVALVWPYVYQSIVYLFQSIRLSQSGGLALFGALLKGLDAFQLSSIVKNAFWYTSYGGTWSSVSGVQYYGDVNIWTAQLSFNSMNGTAGAFITPLYILNIFALPALVFALASMQKDKKYYFYCIIAVLVSVIGGAGLPIELMLLCLSPVLFILHVIYSALLFGLCSHFNLYLGYQSTQTLHSTAMAGNVTEMINYLQYDALLPTILKVVILGIVSFIVYYTFTTFYMHHYSLNLFDPLHADHLCDELVREIGGIDNIIDASANITSLKIRLYDPTKILPSAQKLQYTYLNNDTIVIHFGSGSKILGQTIQSRKRIQQ